MTSGALVENGWDESEAREQATALLRRVGISEKLWDLYPSTYSGGEKQRLNIVHAIIKKPRLLLLEDLKSEGTTMIGVFHDIESLERLSDNVLDLSRGIREEVAI